MLLMNKISAETNMINNTLGERVFEQLKNDILSGTLKPGDRLLYEKIAEKFHVSLTPVKEALLLLEQEGLVKTVPRKGAYVTQLTNRDILEYTQIRLALEGLAIELACETKPDEEAIAQLRLLNREMETAVNEKDVNACMRIDIEFHKKLVATSGNKRLTDLMEQLPLANFFAHVGTQKIMIERSDAILVEHKKIVEALAGRNGELTKAILRQNIRNPYVEIFDASIATEA